MLRTLSLLVVALGFSLSAHAAPADDVNALLVKLTEAFNKGDAKAVTALATDDFDVVGPNGSVGKGKAEAEKIIGSDFTGPLKGATNKITADAVREVGGVWLVDATHEAKGMTGHDGKKMDGKLHVVLLLTKAKDGKLQIAAIRPYMLMGGSHGGAPPPAAPPAPPAPAAPPAKK